MSRLTAVGYSAAALLLVFAPLAITTGASALSLPLAQAEGDVTWSVEPAPTPQGPRRTFEYEVDPGTQIVDSVLITNAGDTAADFLIYATDAINEFDTGAFGLLKRDEEPTDLGAWITPASDTITLQPGTQAKVPFNLLIPSDAAPGDHVAGIVASIVTTGESGGAAVTLEQRVGARIYLNVSGTLDPSVELAAVTSGFTPALSPFSPGNLSVSYNVRNTGNLRVDVMQEIQVAGPFGIPLGAFTPSPILDLLPRQAVRVTTEVPAIVALLLAWSTVTITPGAVGSAEAAAEEPAVGEGETATPTPSPSATSGTSDDSAGATADEVVIEDPSTVDYTTVSSTVATLAVSWTLAIIIVVLVAGGYLVWRYVSGTRERMYLAIDEAAADAREEALRGANVESGEGK